MYIQGCTSCCEIPTTTDLRKSYIITNTQHFPDMIKQQPPLKGNEEYVSYDVESLFTNVPVRETIEYIIDQIYNNEKLKNHCDQVNIQKIVVEISH